MVSQWDNHQTIRVVIDSINLGDLLVYFNERIDKIEITVSQIESVRAYANEQPELQGRYSSEFEDKLDTFLRNQLTQYETESRLLREEAQKARMEQNPQYE